MRNSTNGAIRNGFANALFIALANCAGKSSVPDKRFITGLTLATVTAFYFIILMLAFPGLGLYLFTFIQDIWPWRSDNFRSPKSIGFAFFLIAWVPAFFFWRQVGLGCSSEISEEPPTILSESLLFMWVLVNTFGVFYLSVKFRIPLVVVIAQTASFIVLYAWLRRAGGRMPV